MLQLKYYSFSLSFFILPFINLFFLQSHRLVLLLSRKRELGRAPLNLSDLSGLHAVNAVFDNFPFNEFLCRRK